ncbi:MAG: family 78 glycoside hydrolase catalytic domain [Chthonomonadales bacterium]
MLILKLGAALALAASLPGSPEVTPHAKVQDSARWIWSDNLTDVRDAYRLFRKTFTIKSRPKQALLKITADSEYRLFVNGAYVGRGPAPNPPSYICLDEQDVSKYLTSGTNTIAVIAYHLGIPSFPRVQGRAGLFASLSLPDGPVVTDATWKTSKAWWTPSDIKFSPFREYCETLVGADEPTGWTTSKFKDAGWQSAVELGPAGTAPWTHFVDRDIPFPMHRAATPTAVMFTSIPMGGTMDQKNAADILARQPELPAPTGFDGASLLTSKGLLFLGDGPGIAVGVDFGQEVSGFPELTFESYKAGAIVDVGYGEGLETNGKISVKRQGNPDADRFILAQGRQTLRVFHHRAFRYMVILVRGGHVKVSTPTIIESGYPVQYKGTFKSSDPQLNQIWTVGRRTMQICMDQGFMDCPWRERGQYIGDGLAEGAVAQYAFGDTALMRRFLRQAQYVQPEDGMLEPAYPSDWIALHGTRGPNRIPGYGALWVVMLEEYAKNSGDRELLQELWPVVTKQLGWFDKYRLTNGLLGPVPEWNFIDWADLKPDSALASLNLQYLMSLRAGAEIGNILGRRTFYAGIADRLAVAFEKAHWDQNRKLYRDADGLYTQHTNALALLTVVNDQKRADDVIRNMYDADLKKPESPYFEGYVLKGLCRWGAHPKAMQVIRERWGNMVDKGATTFWESYAAQWSLCHAWSCEPVALLSRDILGVTHNALTGITHIQPNPLDLTSAEGIVPIAKGSIRIGWKFDNTTLNVELSQSEGVHFQAPAGWNVKEIVVTEKSGKTETFDGKSPIVLKKGQTRITVTRQ